MNPGKTIAVIKLTPFLPIPGLILAGASNIKLRKFVTYSVIVTVIYALFMVLLGFYSGVAFLTIAKYVKYMEYLIGGTVLLITLVFFLFRFVSKKVSNRIEKI
jgi:membrane protein DedA with SNARE-associated domain